MYFVSYLVNIWSKSILLEIDLQRLCIPMSSGQSLTIYLATNSELTCFKCYQIFLPEQTTSVSLVHFDDLD